MMTAKQWTVSAIREVMTDAGSHWWSKGAMQSFGTRVLPTVYQGVGGIYFVTSEQPPHGERGFTVRQYDAQKNSITTVGGAACLATRKQEEAKTLAKELAGIAAAEIVEPLEGQDAAPIRHTDLIDRMIRKCEASEHYWAKNHATVWNRAKNHTSGSEAAIRRMIEAAAWYADSHRSRYESGIGEDGFLGPIWADQVKGIRGLLNGETGGYDCGTLDSLLIDMLKAEDLADGIE